MTDKTLGAYTRHEEHDPTYWKGVVREYKDALEEAESRPLTPDAIEVALRDCMPGVALYRLSGTQVMRLAEDMHAALTEPPKRPEGAEDIERLIRDAENEGQGADNEAHIGRASCRERV